MKIPESVDQLPTNGTRGRVYGEPYRTADGGTVITGLISAVIASVALLRRPPWPDLSATSAAWPRR